MVCRCFFCNLCSPCALAVLWSAVDSKIMLLLILFYVLQALITHADQAILSKNLVLLSALCHYVLESFSSQWLFWISDHLILSFIIQVIVVHPFCFLACNKHSLIYIHKVWSKCHLGNFHFPSFNSTWRYLLIYLIVEFLISYLLPFIYNHSLNNG